MRMTLVSLLAVFVTCHNADAIEAMFDGCSEVVRGPVCELKGADTLMVWLATRDAETRWTLNHLAIEPANRRNTPNGQLFEFSLTAPAGQLRALTQNDDTQFELTLRSARSNPHALAANNAMGEGDLQRALAAANTGLAVASDADKASLYRARARIYRRLDQLADSHADFRASIKHAREHEQHYTDALSTLTLAYSLRHDLGDTVGAQALIRALNTLEQNHASSAFFAHYHNATLRFHFEDVREHLLGMRQAATIAQRFDWQTRLLRTHGRMAVQWQHLGRRDKAAALLEPWHNDLPADLADTDRVAFWNSLAWGEVLALEVDEPRRDALSRLQQAWHTAERAGNDRQKINALINLGLGQWHAEQRDAVHLTLQRIAEYPQPRAPQLHFWLLDLQARAALMDDNSTLAAQLYDQMWQRASVLSLPGEQWRALVRKAWVLEASGDDLAALAAYAKAERFADLEVLQVPLHEGRESLLATRRLADHRQLDLLLKQQRPGDAMQAMRRQQARARRLSNVALQVAALDVAQRQSWDEAVAAYHAAHNDISQHYADSWSWSAKELARRTQVLTARQSELRTQLDRAISQLNRAVVHDAEVALPTHIVASATAPAMAIIRTGRGWTALVDHGGQVQTFTAACTASSIDASAACLIETARPAWEDAQQVQLLVDSPLQGIDWHALPVNDGQWIDHVALRYSSALQATQRATPIPGTALLVADPSRNLGGARAEVTAVADALSHHAGWSSSILRGAQATSPLLRQALSGAALFHYAGHASYGNDLGWESALILANDTRFGVGDILTLGQAPQVVVLSGCETATRPGIAAPSMGLANAFLAAGSTAVIATSRTVDDASAREVTKAFYRHWLNGQDVSDALRMAQLDVRAAAPQLDWSAFRLIEP